MSRLVAAIAIVIMGGYALAEIQGARYLRSFETKRAALVAREHEELAQYRRIELGEPLVQQNAAIWYGLAFTNLQQLPADTIGEMAAALRQWPNTDTETLRTLVKERCGEIRTNRAREAMRSAQCDWTSSANAPSAGQNGNEALLFGDCLVLDGHARARDKDRAAAIQRYFTALSFARDLAQSRYVMSLAGMAVANLALSGIATVVTETDNEGLLEVIASSLNAFTGQLPAASVGLTRMALDTAADLEAEALDDVDSPTLFGRLIPRRGVAAWRLASDDRLLTAIRDVAATRDPIERLGQLENVRKRLASSTADRVRRRLLENWDQTDADAEHVSDVHKATQVATALQIWRLQHGSYPPTLSTLGLATNTRLKYDVSADRTAYRLVSEQDWAKGTVLVEAHPRR